MFRPPARGPGGRRGWGDTLVLGLVERLRPAQRRLKDQLNSPVTLAMGIKAGTPLSEALQLLRDSFDLNIVLDRRSFEQAGIKNIDEQPVQLAAQADVALRSLVEKLLQQASAALVARDDIVVVIPRRPR
jgi:hypothetical protein